MNPIEPIGPRPVVRIERVSDGHPQRDRRSQQQPKPKADEPEQPPEPDGEQSLDVHV